MVPVQKGMKENLTFKSQTMDLESNACISNSWLYMQGFMRTRNLRAIVIMADHSNTVT